MKKSYYILAFLLFFSFLIILPYFNHLLFSLILFGFSYPLYQKTTKIFKLKSISALLSLLTILLIFLVSFYIILNSLYQEFAALLKSGINLEILKYIQPYLPNFASKILEIIYSLFSGLTKEILGYILSFFAAYYLLLYSDKIKNCIKEIGIEEKYINYIKTKFYGIVLGHILFWGLQAIISYIGFLILGVKYAALLSLLVFLFAVLPILGPWTVWGVLLVHYFIVGNYVYAIFSFFYGILFVTILTEILVKPFLVGKAADINPFLVFLGILGGISIFNLPGIFIGPLILELSKDFIIQQLKLLKSV